LSILQAIEVAGGSTKNGLIRWRCLEKTALANHATDKLRERLP